MPFKNKLFLGALVVFGGGAALWVYQGCTEGLCLWAAQMESGMHLQIARDNTSAPSTVRIVGPKELLERAQKNGTWELNNRCTFEIDWGEPIRENPSSKIGRPCWQFLTHTYREPISTRITAKMWHTTATDERVIDWTDSIEMLVAGTP